MIVIALIIHNCGVVSNPTPTRRGISRMADPSLIKEIKQALSIPVMAKARVGHFVEADSGADWGRLHRRERGIEDRRRESLHEQAQFRSEVCVRLPRFGGGAAVGKRGLRHDPDAGGNQGVWGM